MLPDPYIHIRMQEQELERTLRRAAHIRAAREANAARPRRPVGSERVGALTRSGIDLVRRALRPARTGRA